MTSALFVGKTIQIKDKMNKFKVGDIITGNKLTLIYPFHYGITTYKSICKVVGENVILNDDEDNIRVKVLNSPSQDYINLKDKDEEFWVCSRAFDLLK